MGRSKRASAAGELISTAAVNPIVGEDNLFSFGRGDTSRLKTGGRWTEEGMLSRPMGQIYIHRKLCEGFEKKKKKAYLSGK